MKITLEEVDHIAMLARLALTAEELDRFRDQLGQIIGYVEMMNQLDLSQVSPSTQVLGIQNITRPDDVPDRGFPWTLPWSTHPSAWKTSSRCPRCLKMSDRATSELARLTIHEAARAPPPSGD